MNSGLKFTKVNVKRPLAFFSPVSCPRTLSWIIFWYYLWFCLWSDICVACACVGSPKLPCPFLVTKCIANAFLLFCFLSPHCLSSLDCFSSFSFPLLFCLIAENCWISLKRQECRGTFALRRYSIVQETLTCPVLKYWHRLLKGSFNISWHAVDA